MSGNAGINQENRPTAEAEMAAYDRLPAQLRRMLSAGPYFIRATDVAGSIGQAEAEDGPWIEWIARMVRQTWVKTLTRADMKWRQKFGGQKYPHIEARATLMFAADRAPQEGGNVRRTVYNRRQLSVYGRRRSRRVQTEKDTF